MATFRRALQGQLQDEDVFLLRLNTTGVRYTGNFLYCVVSVLVFRIVCWNEYNLPLSECCIDVSLDPACLQLYIFYPVV